MLEHPFEFARRAERLSDSLGSSRSVWTADGAVGEEPGGTLKRYAAGRDEHRSVPSDRLFLHAAAARVDGRALVFLGHSTAGKSTLSELLATRYPIIGDDALFLRRTGETSWTVRDGRLRDGAIPGTLSEHDEDTHDQPESPLLSFMRIFKSDRPRIERIDNPKQDTAYW